MVFFHNINPTLLQIGPVEIRYYGLVYVLGFLFVYWYLMRKIRLSELKLTKDELADLVFYNMVGVLVGSRLVHVIFWEPVYYFHNPLKIFYVWEGGMAFHGGLIGVALATYLFWRRPRISKKVSLALLADLLAIPAALILAIGRIANFINGELPGTITNAAWCIDYSKSQYISNPPKGCSHPQVLYAAAKRFIVFIWLVLLEHMAKIKQFKKGFVFWNMVLFFGAGRVIIDFYREDPRLFGLTAGQYLSILMVLVSVYALLKYYSKDIKKVFRSK